MNRQAVIPLGLCLLVPDLTLADPAVADSGGESVRFNTAFIHGGEQPADIKAFLEGNSVLPGLYRVDIYLNRVLSARRDVRFSRDTLTGRVEPCLTLALLQDLGLDPERLKALAELPEQAAPEHCFDLGKLDQASVDYQPNTLALNLSVPQIALRRSARGYLSPELWDEGVGSGFISYSFSGNRRELDRQKTDSYYLGLRNGLNLGAWRLRNESSLVRSDRQSSRFTSNQTYAQRDLTAWKGQLTLGETYSDSRVFDSIRFRGAQVASDDGMLPDSARVYAPTIRGVAESNATVEIRQNGYLLYSSNVPPGPFEISDFYPSGSNGDLLVTVIEADGRRRTFIQAFASLPLMLPKGTFSYSVEAGQYDSNDDRDENPGFASTTLIYGLSELITGFGGVQLAEDFQASNLGLGVNTGLGAVSADLTHSVSRQATTDIGGQSVRLRYANTLNATRTTFALAGYRYSSEHYRSFDQHVDERSNLVQNQVGRARDRFDITLSQPVATGTFSFTALEQRFWNLPGKSRQFNATYGGYWRDLSYSLSVDRTQAMAINGRVDTDHQFTLTLSLPLGRHESSTRASLTAVRDSQGDSSAMAGLSGRVLEQNAFYSVLAGNDGSGARAGSASVNATTSVGRFEAGYSHGEDFNSWNIGARGSLVAHGGGVNLGQSLGDTFALVEVPGVRGARFNNFSGVETGRNGYAVLPYAQPYRANWISLDTRDLGADVEVENAIAQVVPRRGSSTLVRFNASAGRRVQFELSLADGSALPLGASVQDADGKQLAVVDPTSRALVLSDREEGTLQVKGSGQSCQFHFRLPPRDPQLAYDRVKGVCQ
ncbi:fimbria/pilus outer membrane usher protein [Pseudomonas gingeri]|uniref:Fimbrial biogenesis outer membrane usher protein n=1 Tax=Pseudomonas gingeri TaxID=117681 RepID=A0A7Y7YFK0_9PSED|nr:fimbria/pilus outer membrane usher protein [Pseudomonas gingeri]NWA01339.1 fimbrial biogenesis outer membrane usher protein [Pseudomonas gingeri]NWA13858.1 fimbrial biogenesis outer membrane usher protein [Pseudomonas gingeri]NWA52782.1 fimbrial biogenesis outer membrane usher protein [Pseudomonas gingeri]NWA96279.1 fimbrial biogenesis outer membrane usher protein [Pseudomonas gingeri]NWB00085.1 fimbrial biogenesis outer membrane usher protein [Pseudomonas gingeri]